MINVPSMQELLEAGVHFGHQTRRGHPKMSEYIFGVRDGVHIINLESSEKLLKEAAEYVETLGVDGKVLLFVGTKKQSQPIIKELAQKVGAPYIDFRWMGGLLTNFDELRKNVKKLIDLKDKKAKGELGHYTKKEQLLISRKLEKFEREFGGVANMDKLPSAIFLADCVVEKTALAESARMDIPVVGIADSNCNPALVRYPIPGNDDATKSIRILVETIANAYGEGLKNPKTATDDKAVKTKAVPATETPAKEEPVIDKVIAEEVAVAEEIVEKAELKDAKVEV